MADVELYGSRVCEHTDEMRGWLELRGVEFVEYDVEADRQALARLASLVKRPIMVPVLVENGQVVQVGWQGRGCFVGAA
jgi:glutaredoxin